MAEDVFGIVGTVIAGAYHVEGVVAEGGFGVVYRAHHGGFRAPVALKLLKVPQQDPQQQTEFLNLFRAEAELLFRLSASLPTVVRALHVDAFTTSDGRFVPYLVLEWLEGMTLDALIKQRNAAGLAPVPLRKLVRLLTPVARALERAHKFSGPDGPVSIVHRDLKPENIFVAQVAGEEVVKILDFGIGKVKSVASQVAGRMSQDGQAPMAFTPAYGAPEQWAPRHYGQTGPWTDVWGLALCVVEVMAARPIIDGDPATMMGITLDPKRRPTPRNEGLDLPDAIEAVFERALALDPRARQRDVGVFWDELVSALQAPDVAAPALDVDLEFDPVAASQSSQRMAAAAEARALAPAPIAALAPVLAPPRAAATSGAHFVPDLELAPPSIQRHASGTRHAAQPAASQPTLLDFDDAPPTAALDLDLDLPEGETMARRSVSSGSMRAIQPARRSSPPPRAISGSLSAVREPMPSSLSGAVLSARRSTPELALDTSEPPRAKRASVPPRASTPPPRLGSVPPPSPDTSAGFDTGFVARVERSIPEERTLVQRLRVALALLGAAILVALSDPIYAALTGEVLEIVGLRLSVFAGALLLLSLGVATREMMRERQ